MRTIAWLLCTITLILTVYANVEKTIFLGPSAILLPNARPSLEELDVDTLEPEKLSILATQLSVKFPTVAAPRGLESWYILRGLEVGRRYEVRICWPAFVSIQQSVSCALALSAASGRCVPLRLCLCTNGCLATHRLLAGDIRNQSGVRSPRTDIVARRLQRPTAGIVAAQAGLHSRRFRDSSVRSVSTRPGCSVLLFDE